MMRTDVEAMRTDGCPLPLCSDRLLLRRFAMEDITSFGTYRSDPTIAVYQSWISCDRAEATRFIELQSRQKFGVPGEWFQIAIALRNTGELIGDCALKLHPEDVRQGILGVTIARQHQRHGFAVEALSTLLDCLFGEMKLHRVAADTDPRNIGAQRLFERLGFRKEGHSRASLWFKGEWADEVFYGVLREEWLKKVKTPKRRSFTSVHHSK